MKIISVLHNIRSTYNVGAILRTADGIGVDRVALSGYTPKYDDANLLPHLRAKLNHQIEKSALGAEQSVPQEFVGDLPAWLEHKQAAGWHIIGLENNLAPNELSRRWILGQENPEIADNDSLILVLGEEVAGIPPEIRQMVDYFLEIPMHGQKESFNVSVATAIALWALKNSAITRK